MDEADKTLLCVGGLDVVRTPIRHVLGLTVVSVEHIRHDTDFALVAGHQTWWFVVPNLDHVAERERGRGYDRAVPVVLLGVFLPEWHVLAVPVRDEDKVRPPVPELLVQRPDQIFPVGTGPGGDRGRSSDVVVAPDVVHLDPGQVVGERPLELQIATRCLGGVIRVAGGDIARNHHKVDGRIVGQDGLERRLSLVASEPVAPPLFGGVHRGDPEVV